MIRKGSLKSCVICRTGFKAVGTANVPWNLQYLTPLANRRKGNRVPDAN